MTILRKFTLIFLTLTLCWTTVACGGSNETTSSARNVNAPSSAAPTRISDGQYPVQQASFDDATGEYTLFLLNTPSGTPPTFATPNLQMARLTDQDINAGKKSYLKVENNQPVLYLTPDFKIEYAHTATETQANPQTGQQETVVVRQNNGFWAPFAGAVAGNVAGQAIGSLLFRPQYYVPPAYQPGASVITGFGGYGNTYGQAIDRYQTRYNAPPAVVRNRTNFRTTGRVGTPSYSQPSARTAPRYNTGSRSTGSGFGSSTLRPSGNNTLRRPSSSSFGSGRSSGFGSRRSSSGFGSRR